MGESIESIAAWKPLPLGHYQSWFKPWWERLPSRDLYHHTSPIKVGPGNSGSGFQAAMAMASIKVS